MNKFKIRAIGQITDDSGTYTGAAIEGDMAAVKALGRVYGQPVAIIPADLLDEAEKALVALGFDDVWNEAVGWHGTYPKPTTKEHLRCEFCRQEHTVCAEIPHDEDCPVLICRTTLARIRGEKT